jgi:hypothetical protein
VGCGALIMTNEELREKVKEWLLKFDNTEDSYEEYWINDRCLYGYGALGFLEYIDVFNDIDFDKWCEENIEDETSI